MAARIVVTEFVSLDSVFEAPEKCHFPYFDEQMGQEIGAAMDQADAMLMGRVNYEEWADFWPQQDPQENDSGEPGGPGVRHLPGDRRAGRAR